jgi:hypothetical protein
MPSAYWCGSEEGGRVADTFGVEDDDVCDQAFAQEAPVREAEDLRGERGGGAHGVGEAEDAALDCVPADLAGESAKHAAPFALR